MLLGTWVCKYLLVSLRSILWGVYIPGSGIAEQAGIFIEKGTRPIGKSSGPGPWCQQHLHPGGTPGSLENAAALRPRTSVWAGSVFRSMEPKALFVDEESALSSGLTARQFLCPGREA